MKRLLALVFACLYAALGVADEAKTIFALDFDEGQGATVTEKVSGKPLWIKAQPSEEPGEHAWVDGLTGKALALRGSMVVQGKIPYKMTVPFTIELWYKPVMPPLGYDGPLLSRQVYKKGGYVVSTTTAGQVRFSFPCPGKYSTAQSKTSLQLGKWHHIAITYDGKVTRIIINGRLDEEKPMTGYVEMDEPTILSTAGGYYYYQQGAFDRVLISAGLKSDFSAEAAAVAEANRKLDLALKPPAPRPEVDLARFDKDLLLHIPLDGNATVRLPGTNARLEPSNREVASSGAFTDDGVLGGCFAIRRSLAYTCPEGAVTLPGDRGATFSCWVKVNDLFSARFKETYAKTPYRMLNEIVGLKMKGVKPWTYDVIGLNVKDADDRYLTVDAHLRGGTVFAGVHDLKAGVWHNLMIASMAAKGNQAKSVVYIDGRKISVLYLREYPTASVEELWLGKIGGNDGVVFDAGDGKVDEIRLWSRAFSDEEAEAYYAGTIATSGK